MADDSVWPFVTAMVTAAGFTGLIFHAAAFPIGLGAFGLCLLGWFWPSHEPEPIHHRTPAAAGKEAA